MRSETSVQAKTLALTVVERLDEELARVARAAAPVRLRLAEALEVLERSGRRQELGLPSIAAYSVERIGRTGRWTADARTMARRLQKLPKLRAAIVEGVLSWSMGEVLARKAKAETEAGLIDEAKHHTVRQMKAKLAVAGEPDEDDAVPMRTLTFTVPAPDAWAFEFGRMLAAAVQGRKGDEVVVSALLGEASSTMLDLVRGGWDATPEMDEAARAKEFRKMTAAWQREAEEQAEEGLSLHVDPPAFEPDEPLPTTARGLDSLIRRLAARLDERDARIGELARRIFEANGWRRLGFGSETQYARERVGCSIASLRSRMTLSRRGQRFPAVIEALTAGGLGLEAAGLVARVATEKTVDAWIERAKGATYVHLKQEVECIEFLARMSGPAALDDGPPDEEKVEVVRQIEQAVLSGEVFQMFGGRPEDRPEVFQMFGGEEGPKDEEEEPKERLRQGAGMKTVRLRVTEETYWQWKGLEKAFRRTRLPGTFVTFLSQNFFSQWGYLAKQHKGVTKLVFIRDSYCCTNPVCGLRWVEQHHIVYQSRGGGNEATNLTSLCPWCHHHGIHEGRIRIEGKAPDLTWVIGKDPIMVVKGRKKYLLAPGAWHPNMGG